MITRTAACRRVAGTMRPLAPVTGHTSTPLRRVHRSATTRPEVPLTR